MTSLLEKLGVVARRLSVQVATVGSALTGISASLAAAGVPGAAKVATAGAVLTAIGTVVAALVPQASVATYNPQTHDVVAKPADGAGQ